MKFSDLNTPDYILKVFDELGIAEPTKVQERTIPVIEAGKDVIGKSQTGSGKTFAYAIPALEKTDTDDKSTQILVVCPTRELAVQVTGEFRKLLKYREGVKVVPIVGGSTMERQIVALKAGAKIVVGTPGRLNDHLRRRTLKLHNLKMLVLDEADEMLDMGFLSEIEEILTKSNRERQTVMFSATMPEDVRNIAKRYMRSPAYLEIDKADKNDAILQRYVSVGLRDKDAALKELYKKLSPNLAIVFCNTKKMVSSLKKKLADEGIKALEIHGDMPQSERKSVIEKMKSGESNLLIATDVAARGLDISGVDVVFNYDLPIHTEWYTHRIGRTARAGRTGEAYSVVNTEVQMRTLKKIEKETGNVIKEYFCTYSKTVKLPEKKKKIKIKSDGKHGGSGRRGSAYPEYKTFRKTGNEEKIFGKKGKAKGVKNYLKNKNADGGFTDANKGQRSGFGKDGSFKAYQKSGNGSSKSYRKNPGGSAKPYQKSEGGYAKDSSYGKTSGKNYSKSGSGKGKTYAGGKKAHGRPTGSKSNFKRQG